MPGSATAADLRDEVNGREWYHTLELAPGLVTPGWFDARPVVGRLPIPADLSGMRCLDVGTFDGFWAFELERRGAAEVVAVDVDDPEHWDWPAGSAAETARLLAQRKRGGEGFALARRALGSRVERRSVSVYELRPEELGEFDFVYVGSLLLHLRDPVGALERVRSVCRGSLLLVENHHAVLSRVLPRTPMARLDGRGRPWWWAANAAAVVRMAEAAGFQVVSGPKRLLMPAGRGQPRPALGALRGRGALGPALKAWFGDPHVAVLCRPR